MDYIDQNIKNYDQTQISQYCIKRHWMDKNTIFVCGPIELETLNFFKNIKYIPNMRLVIFSGGGKTEPSLEIARIIQKEKIDIYIMKLCASACASYFIPAAKNVYNYDKSIIAYHHNNTFFHYYFNNYFSGKYQIKLKDWLQQEENLYNSTKSNKSILLYPGSMLGIKCAYYIRDKEGSHIKFKFNKNWYAPTKEELEYNFGKKFYGTYITNSSEYKNSVVFEDFNSFIIGGKNYKNYKINKPLFYLPCIP